MERVEHPERAKQIDQKIHKKFDQERTIFILDMSGFSKVVQRYGILHYLAMIHRMRRVVQPVIERHKGAVVKFEADNCFAVFSNPLDAVTASFSIHHDLEIANLITPDESDIHVSIGIGHGKILLACDDMYGNELNLASKLGEDVAERGEILLTAGARKKIKGKKFKFNETSLTVSGVTMKMYKAKK